MADDGKNRALYSSQGTTTTDLDTDTNDSNTNTNRKRDYGPLGHDYVPAADAGPIAAGVLEKLTEGQIHYLIARRLKCKNARNYDEADRILSGLVNAGVYLQDKRKEWRADGQLSFGVKQDKFRYARRGGPGPLSEDELITVDRMVTSRAQAKRNGEFHLSDQLSDTLKTTYGVKVNDKRREWSINTQTIVNNDNDAIEEDYKDPVTVYVPSPIAPDDDPTHLMNNKSKAFIQGRLTDRVVARQRKEYGKADKIRDELRKDYSVVIDDRTKEWMVVTDSNRNSHAYDKFASEAEASQRSAFVRVGDSPVFVEDESEDDDDDVLASPRSNDALDEALEALFGDSPAPVEEQDEEGEPDDSLLTTTPIASVEDEDASVLAPKEKDARHESSSSSSFSDLSTLTVVVLKEKLRTAGLPVSGKKAELIERLMNE
jgi:hypothetical protein